MVVKQSALAKTLENPFESSVISYGSKTEWILAEGKHEFESSVISYGSKTNEARLIAADPFESSVISYGSKTSIHFIDV